ncbi:PHB depolymerase family esterase [Halioxenophilus aromaticivorans]|uniref:PHB depolymerase family esterase n=1 Tax=Halioxenophilus aromaticivorans TaxID=1306992 RepID=A0AAV3U4N8_9ALTE
MAQIKSSNNLNIDQSAISISGLSSGGFMAVQYHLAHSSELTGVASVAGGPYHCAATPSFFCDYMLWFLPRGVCNASYRCTATAKKLLPFGFYMGPPDHEDSVDSALALAEAGLIDPLNGLNNDRVWIFTSGQPNKTPRDTLVPHEIAVQLKDFYQALYNQSEAVEGGDLVFVDSVQAEHSMVIDDPTRDDNCDAFGHPFIDDCSYNTAQQLLDHLYPNSVKQLATSQGQLLSFDQQALPQATMADTGHIYVPAACRQTTCPLHIALHGCGQTQTMIDAALPEPERLYFYRDTGYNSWADTANVVMLYPQAAASEDNENGCWDWWGYSSEDFHNQRAPQILSIRSMVQALTGPGD